MAKVSSWKRFGTAAWLIVLLHGVDRFNVAADDSVLSYSRDVQPLWQKYCVGCHAGEDAEGELNLEAFDQVMVGGEHGPVVTPGEPSSSRVWQVTGGGREPKMPPEEEPQPTVEELELLKRWIEQGARGPEGTSVVDPLRGLPQIARRGKAELPVTAVAVSADGQSVAFARDAEVTIQWESQAAVHVPRNMESIHALEFTPAGDGLLIGGGDVGRRGLTMLVDPRDGQTQQEFVGHTDVVYAAVVSPDGKWLATGGYDRQVILWDLQTGEQRHALRGHNGAVFTLAFSPDSKVLASGSADETIKLWRIGDGARLDTLSQSQGAVRSLEFSADGSLLVAGSADRCFRVWQVVSHDEPAINPLIATRVADQTGIDQIGFLSSGKQLVVVSQGRQVKLWDVEGWQLREVCGSLTDQATGIAIVPRTDRVWIGQQDGVLREMVFPRQATTAVLSSQTQAQAAGQMPGEQYFEAELLEVDEIEGNDGVELAQSLAGPARVRGKIGGPGRPIDEDWFRFSSEAGKVWMIEVEAAREGSPLDSVVEVLAADGSPIERVRLQAVRDTYFTFRGKDSSTSDDFRMFNWEEMELNEYLYANGEVVKLWHYPRGPDSGFMVYPGEGDRWTYFDSTPMAHALAEPAYIVRPLEPSESPVANGLPVFTLHYENDDDPQRRWGCDSRLRFVAPHTATYLIRLRDIRGHAPHAGHGHAEEVAEAVDGSAYQLAVRPARPDFRVNLSGFVPEVPQGGGRDFKIAVERLDGFEGPVSLEVSGLPPGVRATSPLVIEEGQIAAFGLIYADLDAPIGDEPGSERPTDGSANQGEVERKEPAVKAHAIVNGCEVAYDVAGLATPKVVPSQSVQIFIRPVDRTQSSSIVDEVAQPSDASDQKESLGKLEVWTMLIEPGSTASAEVHVLRRGHDNPVSFGNADAGRNLPHGCFVDNIGLNGLLVMPGHNRRTFFVTASPVSSPQQRMFYLRSDQDNGVCSWPVRIEVVER
jgi:hypothetical protein